jgi:tetratricopeptide (TPR) repeat protein
VLFGAVELGEARRREAEERQKRERLQRHEDAREDFAKFRRLSEERHFYSAFTTPAGEGGLQYDSRRGEEAGKRALEIAERLGAGIEDLDDEREAFQKEYYDLLLSLGEKQRAEAQRGQVPPSHVAALDHFLAGERHRTQASAPRRADGTDWQPNAEELGKAIAEYQEALRIEPRQYWCYFQMGRCYLSLRQGTEAVEALSTCVALDRDRPWGYSARGLTLGLIGRFGEGEGDLEKALDRDPYFYPALLHRGILAWLQGQYDRALADFVTVLDAPEGKRLIEAAYYRGQLRLERRQLDEARQDFDRVVKENPGFRPVYLSRAQVHFLRDDPEQGLVDLRTFLDLARPGRLDPAGPEVFELRGRLLRHLVRRWGLSPDGTRATLELARDSLNRAAERGGRSAELLDDRGAVLEFLGKPAEALKDYEQALKAEPSRDLKVKIHLRRGQLYLNPPQYQRARDEYAEALRLGPGEAEAAEAHAGLGYVAAVQGLAGEAQREAAQALHLRAGDYLILHWVACIYAQLSRHDPREARQHQDFAMTLINRALQFAQEQGAGTKELAEVLADDAFEPLWDRPDFKKLREGH